jgi:5'-methylthioadenosine phosphorylase
MWAIVGGSGFENFSEFETVEQLSTETPFGSASSGLRKVKVAGKNCLFLSRHGSHHELQPSEVNYRANIYALKKHGAKNILSISAVGSLVKDCKPGDLVVPDQYIDRTKSLRNHTFCGDGVVGHVSLAKPVCAHGVKTLKELAPQLKFQTHFSKTYICIEGPYFSTQAESKSYRAMGADIIGMTNFPEFALAREAGLHYLPCSFVTDYDCWDDSIPHVTLAEVIQVMKLNNSKAFEIVKALVGLDPKIQECGCREGGLKAGLMTPSENIPADKKDWLNLILA